MRFFVFGCSFTQYMWPTWSDIVAYDMDIEYHNYALPGMGNVGIQCRMLEADIKHRFNKDDVIMIMWSSWCREDRVRQGQWLTAGSVLNPYNGVYDRKFLKRYWDYSNDIVKNSTAIITANKIYKNNISWQGSGLPLFFTEGEKSKNTVEENALINLYKDYIPNIDNVNTFKNDWDDLAFGSIDDCHPDVKAHLNIVENHVYKHLNVKLKSKTRNRFVQIHEAIAEKFKNKIHVSLARDEILKALRDFYDVNTLMNTRILFDK